MSSSEGRWPQQMRCRVCERAYVVRAEVIDGQPWFVARDVCAALGIEWNGRVSAAIRDDWRGVSQFDTPGGTQELVIIAEGAVYKLAFRSRKPEAERCTDWVAGDVLPALRERRRRGRPVRQGAA